MTNALKEAQKDNRYLMRALHEACRYDFCKPYVVKKIYGKYTENKIRKLMAETLADGKPITPYTHKIVILTKCEDRYIYNRWHLVEILGTRIDIDTRSKYSYSESFDYFYAKSKFHEVRKSDTCQTIILAQSYADLCELKTSIHDMYGRMKVLDVHRCRTWNADKEYIGSLVLRDTDGSRSNFYTHGEPKTLDGVIDKSGYLLDIRRTDLRHRLKDRKAKLSKAVADSTDFSEHLTTLTTLVDAKKLVLTETFKNCKTYVEYKKFEEAFAYYGGFMNIVENYEEYRKDVLEKGFRSVEEETNRYNSLMKKLMV